VSHCLVVVLNLDTLGLAWRAYSSLVLERGVTVAASVAHDALTRGQMVGLFTNGTSLLYERPMSVLPARDRRQYLSIFETLAMVGPYLSGTVEEVLERHRARLPFGATLVLVTGVFTQALAQLFRELQRVGYGVHVLYVGEGPPEAEVPSLMAFQDLSPFFRAHEATDEWE